MRSYVHGVVEIDDQDIAPDIMNRFFGEAYDLLTYSEKRWPWFETSTTFNTVSSPAQSDYALSYVGAAVTNGLREIASLRDTSSVIEYIGRDEGDLSYPLSSAGSGVPFRWSFWEDKVRLYPTPSTVVPIHVRGWANPPAFGAGSQDGDEPVPFPTPFHILIATYGCARAYEQQEDLEMGATYHAMFRRELDNLRARFLDTPAPQPIILNGTRSRRWDSNVALGSRLRYSWE